MSAGLSSGTDLQQRRDLAKASKLATDLLHAYGFSGSNVASESGPSRRFLRSSPLQESLLRTRRHVLTLSRAVARLYVECSRAGNIFSGPSSSSKRHRCHHATDSYSITRAFRGWSDTIWDRFRLPFLTLYIDENRQLQEVAVMMSSFHAFSGTPNEWRHHLRRWQRAGLGSTCLGEESSSIRSFHGARDTETAVQVTGSEAFISELQLLSGNTDQRRCSQRITQATGTAQTPDQRTTFQGNLEAFYTVEEMSLLGDRDIEAGLVIIRERGFWNGCLHIAAGEVTRSPIMVTMGVGMLVFAGLQYAKT
jgi:hypothetical protein